MSKRVFMRSSKLRTMNTTPREVENLRFYRRDPGPIYQIYFTADGLEHCHEYPIREVARTEEEAPAEKDR